MELMDDVRYFCGKSVLLTAMPTVEYKGLGRLSRGFTLMFSCLETKYTRDADAKGLYPL